MFDAISTPVGVSLVWEYFYNTPYISPDIYYKVSLMSSILCMFVVKQTIYLSCF